MLTLVGENFCAETANVWQLIGLVIFWLKIAIPIIIILLAILDLGKAVMAGDDKDIKAAEKMLFKRIIFGVAIFFVATLIMFVFGLVGQSYGEGDKAICWTCATKPNNSTCTNHVQELQ